MEIVKNWCCSARCDQDIDFDVDIVEKWFSAKVHCKTLVI